MIPNTTNSKFIHSTEYIDYMNNYRKGSITSRLAKPEFKF